MKCVVKFFLTGECDLRIYIVELTQEFSIDIHIENGNYIVDIMKV